MKNFEGDVVKVDVSKVEITQYGNNYGLFALQNIKKGEAVYVERAEIFHVLTEEDMSNPACDACFLVRKIFQDSQTEKLYYELGLESSNVGESKPSRDDRIFLKRLAKKSKVSYERVLEIWLVVCAYHVKAVQDTYISQRIRLQLSKNFNRTNHSCNPNSDVIHKFSSKSDFDSRLLIVKASRPIKNGEEVTFSYLDPSVASILNVESRRELIKSTYGFTCMCDKCIEESDYTY